MPIPDRFPIVREENYHSHWMGKLADGRQFFATTPFVSRGDDRPGCEYIAVFLFAEDGAFLEAKIDDLGRRADLDDAVATKLFKQRISELGPYTFSDIYIAPFSVERFGIEFGLIPSEKDPEEEFSEDCITLLPGDYMEFTDPWDGYYST